MKYLSFLYLVFFVVLLGCADKVEEKTNRQTEIFSKYMKSTFDYDLPERKHYFMLILRFRCIGCVEKNIKELEEFVNDENKNYLTFITSEKDFIPGTLKEKINTLYDVSNKFEKLNLNLANLTLIEVESRKIRFIKSLNPDDPQIKTFLTL